MMYNHDQILKVTNILKENKTNYWTGNECKSFEKEFSKYVGNKYSITVSNGSVALEIALKSLNLKIPSMKLIISSKDKKLPNLKDVIKKIK